MMWIDASMSCFSTVAILRSGELQEVFVLANQIL